jgi:hypothetical protein
VFAEEKQTVTAVAVSHSAEYRDSNNRSITCYGNSCNVSGGFEWVSVKQVVDVGDMRYTLGCSGVPFRSLMYRKCSWLPFEGDKFPAEIKGRQMTVFAPEGGNQGKPIKMKFEILDIRPTPRQ